MVNGKGSESKLTNQLILSHFDFNEPESVQPGRYRNLLCCYRYIELNPVRAGLVRTPEDYTYSSYHANALGKEDKLITPHPVFLDLIAVGKMINGSKLKFDRSAYLNLFTQILSRKDLVAIRRGTEKGMGIGQANFLLRIAALSSRWQKVSFWKGTGLKIRLVSCSKYCCTDSYHG